MWLPKARQTTRSREEEVKHARQTLSMFEQMQEMARDMGDERMLDMARELIIDQRRSLDVLVADQQQAIARAQARREAAASERRLEEVFLWALATRQHSGPRSKREERAGPPARTFSMDDSKELTSWVNDLTNVWRALQARR